jgi:signal transduction histidine kinase
VVRVPNELGFADEPRSDLERTVGELVHHAQRVLDTESRLRGLLEAYRSVVKSLDIDDVLRRIVDAAVSLVDARDGAIVVFDENGGVERLIRVRATVADGPGPLSALADAAPAPLEKIERDPRSAGIPLDDPGAFLGVPVRSHGDAYGALYLAERPSGPFTHADEELVAALAATAGVALENARLYEESRRRQRWSAALAEVSSALLSEDVTDYVGVIVARVGSVVEADVIGVVVPIPDSDELLIQTSRGVRAERFEGRSYPREGSLVDRALASGHVVLAAATPAVRSVEAELGPSMVLPVVVAGEPICALTLSRASGRAGFTSTDVDMASEFATQVGLAVELTRARADRHRLELADERGRIARDLHDHVIQRLFATGMSLQATAARFPAAAPDLQEQVDAIDAAIGEIRTVVFALTARRRESTDTTRYRLLDVVSEMTESMGSSPRLTFSGAIDLLVTDELADDVVAVVRECLANAARHASADEVTVDVTVDDGDVVVTVTDDGVGVSPVVTRRSGTENLGERARRRGGDFDIGPAEGGGTRVVWRASLAGTRKSA